MTDRDGSNAPQSDRPLEELVVRALADAGELIPTTEAEVARAEAAGVESVEPLPASLREFRAERAGLARVVALGSARRATPRHVTWLGHGVAAVLGAAAALGLVWLHSARHHQARLGAGQDPRREPIDTNAVASSATTQFTVKLGDACAPQCCAGIDCKTPTDKPKECASHRRCVRCMESDASGERYRLRTGRIAPTQALLRLLEGAPDKVLEACFRVNAVSSGGFSCTPAQARGDSDEAWALLPIVASGADLLSGLVVQLRWRGEAIALGEWTSPIQSNTAVLCSGLAIKPKQPDGELLGTLSVFLDDTYYVEIGRGRDTAGLTKLIRGYQFEGVVPKLFETEGSGDNRFAATLGPLSRAAAEQGRWQLLQHGAEAKVVVGVDYRGEPMLVK